LGFHQAVPIFTASSYPSHPKLELQPETLLQGHLFEQQDTERSKLLMSILDSLNRQFGARTMQYASAWLKKGWGMKQERRTLGASPFWKS
jgi:Domain of unknown function (DUF4113)